MYTELAFIPCRFIIVMLIFKSGRMSGGEKRKLRAKGSVFWANINKDIDEMIKSCPPFQRHHKLNVREPLLPHDVPQKAWHTLSSDLFHWNSTDYCSKLPVVKSCLTPSHSTSTPSNVKSLSFF